MDFLANLADNAAVGFATAATPSNLLYCFIGVTLGTLLGVIPGIGTLAALSMLFPITFYLDPAAALIMLAGIYYGTSYGGSTASILLNLPGTPSSAVACLDGYPMSKQGRAGIALFITTIASFVGGSIGILIMMLFAGPISTFAFQFGPAEYFSLMALGLVAAATISTGSPAKGIAMVLFGVLIGLVGMDIYTGTARYSFGMMQLADGITLIAVAMGIFGVSEVIASIRAVEPGGVASQRISFRSMVPTRDDLRRSPGPILRGSGVGAFFGSLPGTGGTVAAFVSYALERRVTKEPWRFGKGAIEGVAAPEAANNAGDQTAFIPTLTLGVPGSAPMAIILSVLIIHGITPGPTMVVDQPELFWGLVMSFWIGNFLLLVLNIPLIGIWVRVLAIPYHLLYPAVLMFVCIGVYSVNHSVFDVWLVVLFGVIGYGMRLLDFPAAPLLLGFVLGPLLEEHFRRAMLLSRGDFGIFFQRPIAAIFVVISLLVLSWACWSGLRPRRTALSATRGRPMQ